MAIEVGNKGWLARAQNDVLIRRAGNNITERRMGSTDDCFRVAFKSVVDLRRLGVLNDSRVIVSASNNGRIGVTRHTCRDVMAMSNTHTIAHLLMRVQEVQKPPFLVVYELPNPYRAVSRRTSKNGSRQRFNVTNLPYSSIKRTKVANCQKYTHNNSAEGIETRIYRKPHTTSKWPSSSTDKRNSPASILYIV